MLETKNPEINVAELQDTIDAELEKQERRLQEERSAGRSCEIPVNDPYKWAQLGETLKMAELNVNAGAEVTTMLHYRGIVRKFARFLGKITIFLGRVITIPQRNFNSSILHAQRITLDGIRDMNRNTALMDHRLQQIDRQLAEKSALIDYLKTGLVAQERRVSILLEELRNQEFSPSAGTADTSAPGKGPGPDLLEPLYLAFENKFRGSREDIRTRLLEYLPLVREAGAGEEGRAILDIGCGRGEWLEILRDERLEARGVDLNHVLAQECRHMGFEVSDGDGTLYLRTLPDNSLGGITAFHLIEHLNLDERIALFDECVRVLKPGGVALFETPNPRNLLVGSCNFWADPTHLRPLYPETHQFLMEYRGFSRVELIFLHPHEQEQRLPEDEAPRLASRLNDILSCARDYTVVGYKA